MQLHSHACVPCHIIEAACCDTLPQALSRRQVSRRRAVAAALVFCSASPAGFAAATRTRPSRSSRQHRTAASAKGREPNELQLQKLQQLRASGGTDKKQKLEARLQEALMYKGARTYGKVDEDDFEEARRIREGFDKDASGLTQSKESRVAAARKRLQEKKNKREDPETAEAALDEELDEEQEEADATNDDNSNGARADAQSEGTAASRAGGSAFITDNAGTVAAALDSSPARTGNDDSIDDWLGWPPALELGPAKRIAKGSLRRQPVAMLQAGARALSGAGDHREAASLLRELRDFGVDRGVLERRLDLSAASKLSQDAAVLLGLELKRADLQFDAWKALLAACAEQPGLRKALHVPTLQALSAVSDTLTKRNCSNPAKQVEVLQGVVDAYIVLQKASKSDSRERLELELALALTAAGRKREGRELLTTLSRTASQMRRQQASWALLVQDADLGDEPIESVTEMRNLWSESAGDFASVTGGGIGAAGVAGRLAAGASGKTAGFGSSTESSMAVAALVFVLPLALLLLLYLRGQS